MPHSSLQATQSTLPVTATSQKPTLDAPLIGLTIAVAISLVLALFSYRKYCAYQRSRLLKRQIAMLEAIWRISSTKRDR